MIYEDQIAFFTVYTREAHPIDGHPMVYTWDAAGNPIEQPDTYDERVAMAEKTASEANVSMRLLVDAMDDPVYCSYGGMPNSAFLIGEDGKIVLAQTWNDPNEMQAAIEDIVAR